MMAKEGTESRVEEETTWGGREMVRAGEWGAQGEAEVAKV